MLVDHLLFVLLLSVYPSILKGPLVGVLLTDGGEGAEKEEERTRGGEEGTRGVGVELRVERGEYPEL